MQRIRHELTLSFKFFFFVVFSTTGGFFSSLRSRVSSTSGAIGGCGGAGASVWNSIGWF